MSYSAEQLEAMRYDPVALRAYFWSVAMHAKRRSLIAKREIIQRGQQSAPPGFKGVYEHDGYQRESADVDARLSQVILENLDALVKSCLERPKPCDACRQANE